MLQASGGNLQNHSNVIKMELRPKSRKRNKVTALFNMDFMTHTHTRTLTQRHEPIQPSPIPILPSHQRELDSSYFQFLISVPNVNAMLYYVCLKNSLHPLPARLAYTPVPPRHTTPRQHTRPNAKHLSKHRNATE